MMREIILASHYLNKSIENSHSGELVRRIADSSDVHPDTIYALAKLLKTTLKEDSK